MNIVLINPEIPQNTGSIARTCAATNTALHLVGKLGFELSDKQVRRAGLDYWPYVDVCHHQSWEDFKKACPPEKIWLLTKFATRPYYTADFSASDSIVFGCETKGLGPEFLSRYSEDQKLSIPMPCKDVRSLNLSNAVSIVLYEALKETNMI